MPSPWGQIITQAIFLSLCPIHERAGRNCQVRDADDRKRHHLSSNEPICAYLRTLTLFSSG